MFADDSGRDLADELIAERRAESAAQPHEEAGDPDELERRLREQRAENERLRTALTAIIALAQSPSWEVAHDALR